MGIIFNKTLKCENCGYVYQGRNGGHIISNGERYGISQYYCSTCHSIIDLEYYSSLKENKEKYIYPDGTEVSYEIIKKDSETNDQKNEFPLCKECGNHLFRIDIGEGDYANCPKCGHKSLKQKAIHVNAYID